MTDSSGRRFVNPPALSRPPGFSQVVEVTAPGRTIYVTGQVGTDATGKLAGEPGDFRAQAIQVFENLKAALAAVDADIGHVVKFNIYLVDIAAHLATFRQVRDLYVDAATAPASTLVQVGGLVSPAMLIEVEAIAAAPAC
jgi:enamine deaminase RidA (YjgF/YER057c/UK114 family)